MTTIGMARDRGAMVPVVRGLGRTRQVLLACGILSPLLYVATDILGGFRYDGYSFSSQAISELMAKGAPSERFVDPLFLIYGVLLLGFGAGVFREGAGRNRPLRIAGVLLMANAALGFTGPTLFEMSQRGAGSLAGDAPHIVLTGVLSLLILLYIGFGGWALGWTLRKYSLGTLLVVIAFGAMTAPNAALLAAGQPTPGFGVFERVSVYTSMLWMAVFAIVLLRKHLAAARRSVR
jgi:hypothetical membrane protein